MLDIEYIFTWFQKLTRLNEPEATPWLPLCESAARVLLSRLRPDVDLEAEMDRLCMAAASIAHSTFLSHTAHAENAFSGDSIRVGDITLKSTAGTARAMARDENGFLAHIADLLAPKGFAFLQTPKQQEPPEDTEACS